ncbi:MAG: hypothetical protein M1165_02870 [Candidatus Pacearchaeota archaeon]|nr:hypothetical protein [Candidatus Pacearchaeota archaeon]MDE1848898.1 hypothetical protein [Nanoarchaeota archaeon]
MSNTKNKREVLRKLMKTGDNVKLIYTGNPEGATPLEFETKQDKLGFRENLKDLGFGYYLRTQGNRVPLRAVRSIFYSPIEDCFHINLDWNYIYFHKPHIDLQERATNNVQQVMEAIGWD